MWISRPSMARHDSTRASSELALHLFLPAMGILPGARRNLAPRRSDVAQQYPRLLQRLDVIAGIGLHQARGDVVVDGRQLFGHVAAALLVQRGEQAVVDDIQRPGYLFSLARG